MLANEFHECSILLQSFLTKFLPYAVLLPGRKQLSRSLPHRRCPPLLNIGLLGLLLGDALVKDLGVLVLEKLD